MRFLRYPLGVSKTESRAYHHGDLRRALLDAAAKLVAEGGADRFTMADAGRRAGVSSGAPYRHFADREALMRALALEARAFLAEAMAEAARAASDEPLAQFRAAGIAYVRFAAERPGHFLVLCMPEYGLGDSSPQSEEDVAYWSELVRWVNAHPTDVALDARNPIVAQFAGRVLVHGLAHLFVLGFLPKLGIGTERATQLADAITRAVSLLAFGPPTPPSAIGGRGAQPKRAASEKQPRPSRRTKRSPK